MIWQRKEINPRQSSERKKQTSIDFIRWRRKRFLNFFKLKMFNLKFLLLLVSLSVTVPQSLACKLPKIFCLFYYKSLLHLCVLLTVTSTSFHYPSSTPLSSAYFLCEITLNIEKFDWIVETGKKCSQKYLKQQPIILRSWVRIVLGLIREWCKSSINFFFQN